MILVTLKHIKNKMEVIRANQIFKMADYIINMQKCYYSKTVRYVGETRGIKMAAIGQRSNLLNMLRLNSNLQHSIHMKWRS